MPHDAEPPAAVRIRVVLDGTGPPPFHVRDQARVLAALPRCEVVPADRAPLTAVAVAPYPATVWLPDVAGADPLDGPGPAYQGWAWPSGELLMLAIERRAGLPGLHALIGYDAWTSRATLAGRPVAVTRAPGGPAEDGRARYPAQVEGYLDDRTHVWADVDAPSAAARDLLLAALLTLTPRDRQAGPVAVDA